MSSDFVFNCLEKNGHLKKIKYYGLLGGGQAQVNYEEYKGVLILCNKKKLKLLTHFKTKFKLFTLPHIKLQCWNLRKAQIDEREVLYCVFIGQPRGRN